jgi:hypothetical protein
MDNVEIFDVFAKEFRKYIVTSTPNKLAIEHQENDLSYLKSMRPCETHSV